MIPGINLSFKDIVDIVQKKKILKQRKGKNYFSAYPKFDKNRVLSAAQLKNQDKFKRCAIYAREAIKDPEMKKAYEKVAKQHQTAYNRAFTDASGAPEIVSILIGGYRGKIGDSIYINAQDDFRVKKVVVRFFRNKKLLQEGEAGECAYNMWQYKSTKLIKKIDGIRIVAMAYDIPGNFDTKEQKM